MRSRNSLIRPRALKYLFLPGQALIPAMWILQECLLRLAMAKVLAREPPFSLLAGICPPDVLRIGIGELLRAICRRSDRISPIVGMLQGVAGAGGELQRKSPIPNESKIAIEVLPAASSRYRPARRAGMKRGVLTSGETRQNVRWRIVFYHRAGLLLATGYSLSNNSSTAPRMRHSRASRFPADAPPSSLRLSSWKSVPHVFTPWRDESGIERPANGYVRQPLDPALAHPGGWTHQLARNAHKWVSLGG